MKSGNIIFKRQKNLLWPGHLRLHMLNNKKKPYHCKMQKIHTIWWFSVVQYIPCRHSLLISVCIYYRSFCPCHKLCYMDPTLWCSTGSQQLERNQVILYLKSKRIFFGPVISESIAFFISVTPSDYPLSLCTK